MYVDGKKYTTMKTVYNPIEKGMTLKKAMEINKKNKINNVERDSKIVDSNIQPMSYTTTHYWWDGVYFVSGHMIDYPHPDYDYYGLEPNMGYLGLGIYYKYGYSLYHCKVDKSLSQASPATVGAIIGAYIGARMGSVDGAVIGAAIGAFLGVYSTDMLTDENGCIWFWFAKEGEWKYFGSGGIQGWHYVPKYVRVADYTLWDDLGIGNPY